MKATDEQIAIVDAVRSTSDNLLANALAGTGKTTILKLIEDAWYKVHPQSPLLYLAFAKRDKLEAEKRLSSKTTVQTINGCGCRIWMNSISPRVITDPQKMKNLLKEKLKELKGDDRFEAGEAYFEIISAIGMAKSMGYIPKKYPGKGLGLISEEGFWQVLEEEPSPFIKAIINSLLIESINLAFKGNIDFDDQIYMPALFGGTFPRFPLVLLDEGQDQNPTNHVLLHKLGRDRIAIVGDRWQSIYAFRGAVTGGMEKLKEKFQAKEFPLTISFRCPEKIVEAARWRVPDFKWVKPGGHHETLQKLRHAEIPDGAAIICRNNAPLFRLAFNLLQNRRSVSVTGSEVGPKIIRLLQKIGSGRDTSSDLAAKIEAWKYEKLQTSNSPKTVEDQAECMKVFATWGRNLDEAVTYAQHLFGQTGTITLTTGHKSKGGEWDTVFHLDPWLIGDDDQEQNLRYVITTRSKDKLFEINSKDIVNGHA